MNAARKIGPAKTIALTDRFRVEIKWLGAWWRLEQWRQKLYPEAYRHAVNLELEGDVARTVRESDGEVFP